MKNFWMQIRGFIFILIGILSLLYVAEKSILDERSACIGGPAGSSDICIGR